MMTRGMHSCTQARSPPSISIGATAPLLFYSHTLTNSHDVVVEDNNERNTCTLFATDNTSDTSYPVSVRVNTTTADVDVNDRNIKNILILRNRIHIQYLLL